MLYLFQKKAFAGSATMLGNPAGLAHNIADGLHDFWTEPAQGSVKSPADFGIGVAKGFFFFSY